MVFASRGQSASKYVTCYSLSGAKWACHCRSQNLFNESCTTLEAAAKSGSVACCKLLLDDDTLGLGKEEVSRAYPLRMNTIVLKLLGRQMSNKHSVLIVP